MRGVTDKFDHDMSAPYDTSNHVARSIIKPLSDEVHKHELWACHLGSELGGQGYDQIKLALMARRR